MFDWQKRFGMVGWISVMIYGLGDPVFPTVTRAFRTQFWRTRRSVRDIAYITGLSLGNVYAILTTQLEMTEVCARWVHATRGSYFEKER